METEKQEKIKVKEKSKSPLIKKRNNLTEAFGKVIKGNSLNNEIKIKFREFLEKLNDKDTRQIGFNETKLLINKYSENKYCILYLPLLLEYNKNSVFSAKEFQIILIGYTISICGWEGLGGEKSIIRVIESIEIFFKEGMFPIQKACSNVFIELSDIIIAHNASDVMLRLLITPLIDYINTCANEAVQINKNNGVVSSCIILSELVVHINSDEIIFGKKEEFKIDVLNQLLQVLKVSLKNLLIINYSDIKLKCHFCSRPLMT